jgi:hypothetical protein
MLYTKKPTNTGSGGSAAAGLSERLKAMAQLFRSQGAQAHDVATVSAQPSSERRK